jgi:hypothetical protein
MARPKQIPSENTVIDVDHDARARDTETLNQLAVIDQAAEVKTAELANRLGYQGPLVPDLLEFGVAQQMHRTVEACLETGKMLLLLKERVDHGDFLSRLERLGLAKRAAQKFMQACLKFSNAPLTAHLTRAIGNQGKLIELLILDDDQVQELAEEGSTLGIALDDIARMSQQELRAALRQAREDIAAKDELVTVKNAKIDKLISSKRYKPGPDAIAQNEAELALLEELHSAAHAIEPLMLRLSNVLTGVGTHPSVAMKKRCNQVAELLAAHLADLVDTHGLTVNLSAAMDLRPDWLKTTSLGAAVEEATEKALQDKAANKR